MSDDLREAQRKSDRPAASTTGFPGRVAPAPGVAAAPGVAPAPAAPPLPGRPGVPAAVPVPGPDAEADWDAAAAAGPDTYDDDFEDEEDEEDEEPVLSWPQRIRRVPPAAVILTIGSLGSLIFLASAVTSHTTPVPVLMSAGVVTGLIFAVDVAILAASTWAAVQQGRSGRAIVLALVGGLSAFISAGCLAAILVMILVLNG